jgi:hypothetical protein
VGVSILHIVPLPAHKHNIDVMHNLNLDQKGRFLAKNTKKPNAVAEIPAR